MTHDLLNDLQVGFVFAETGAERMPEMVAAKVGQEPWLLLPYYSLRRLYESYD